MVLIGNKNDLINQREVTYEEGETFAKNHKMMFLEVSAKTGNNVNEIFEESVKKIANNISKNVYDLGNDSCGIRVGVKKDSFVLSGDDIAINDKHKKKRCC